jgi:hypothetical protein
LNAKYSDGTVFRIFALYHTNVNLSITNLIGLSWERGLRAGVESGLCFTATSGEQSGTAAKIPDVYLHGRVPNDGLRPTVTAARLTTEGVRRGVPDICLPVARGGYHGVYIELKRRKAAGLLGSLSGQRTIVAAHTKDVPVDVPD